MSAGKAPEDSVIVLDEAELALRNLAKEYDAVATVKIRLPSGTVISMTAYPPKGGSKPKAGGPP